MISIVFMAISVFRFQGLWIVALTYRKSVQSKFEEKNSDRQCDKIDVFQSPICRSSVSEKIWRLYFVNEPQLIVLVVGLEWDDEQQIHRVVCCHDVSILGKNEGELFGHLSSKRRFDRTELFRF